MGVGVEARQHPVMAATLDESRLRYPTERAVYVATMLLNIVVIIAATMVFRMDESWKKEHRIAAKVADGLKVSAAALLLAPIALGLMRNRRRNTLRANALRLGPTQFPEVYEAYTELCTTLGIHEPPELYVVDEGLKEPSMAASTWHSQFIGINARFLEPKLEVVRPVYRFLLARELGRLRLGHTHWLDELLIAHVSRIPVLRNPLLHARTFSQDRYAAALVPDGVRGLVVLASGRHILSIVDVESFLRQARALHGRRSVLGQFKRSTPFLAKRIEELDRAGMAMTDVATMEAPDTRTPAARAAGVRAS